ncbi:MAG TPA: hypothetical protein DCF68_13455 [Cyanothece sp. UBA12306]|nr:hypothetical protein [Cyanothece sp. UBA12306]
MKCISCGTDNNYRDRQDKKCKNCGHEFVFEPKTMTSKITDGLFAKIINDISFNQTIFYTQKQFDYYFDKLVKNRQSKFEIVGLIFLFCFFNIWFTGFVGAILGTIFGLLGNNGFIIANLLWNTIYVIWLVRKSKSTKINVQERSQTGKVLLFIGMIILMILGFISLIIIKSFLMFVITTILGMTSIHFGVIALLKKKPMVQEFLVEQSKLREWQNRWNSINSTPEKLLSPIIPNQNLIPNSDLNHYSFDRLVVCQKDEIAHFLIANNFHLENNCAILSITGYPENTFQTVLDMAKQNPNLKVYAIHDCSFSGMNLVYNLQTRPNWFLNYQIQLYDLGLSYQQVMEMPNAFVRKDSNYQKIELPFEVRQKLSSEAVKWLESGYYVELESFSPKYLLKVLKQGINQTSQLQFNQEELPDNWQESERDDSTAALIVFSSDSFG